MNQEFCLQKLKEFKNTLIKWTSHEREKETRSEINKQITLVKKIIEGAGTKKLYSYTPPPMTGDFTERKINPLDYIFLPLLGFPTIQFIFDIIDETIGVIESDENFAIEVSVSKMESSSQKTETEKINLTEGRETITNSIKCSFCKGSGHYPNTPLDDEFLNPEPCPVCKGYGIVNIEKTFDKYLTCNYCGGDGKKWSEDNYSIESICPVCSGVGIIDPTNASSFSKENCYDFWMLLHPKIVELAKERYNNGFYADAIEATLKELNSRIKQIVRTKTNEELDGARLMQRAFSVENPVIKLSNLSNESERDIQKGYMQIFSGAMTGIRNPKAHENRVISREKTIHLFFLSSLLFFKIDEAL